MVSIENRMTLKEFNRRREAYIQHIQPLVNMRVDLLYSCRIVLMPDGTIEREYPEEVRQMDEKIKDSMDLIRDYFFNPSLPVV